MKISYFENELIISFLTPLIFINLNILLPIKNSVFSCKMNNSIDYRITECRLLNVTYLNTHNNPGTECDIQVQHIYHLRYRLDFGCDIQEQHISSGTDLITAVISKNSIYHLRYRLDYG